MRFGNFDVQILNDGSMRNDGGAMFGVVPRVLWQRKVTPDDRNRVTMALRSLLIRAPDRTFLVDTGIGDRYTEKEADIFAIERPVGLIRELARHSVRPEDVDVVINTHLHVDHASGNTTRNAEGQIVPTFPRAEYWIQRGEWDDAIHPNERTAATYLADNLQPIQASGQLRLVDGPVQVAPGFRWILAPGHTANHTNVLIESGDRSLLFTVDVCPFVAHLERIAWIPAYDVLPLVAMETKRKVIADVLAHNRLVVFDHDPNVVAVRLTGTPSNWKVEDASGEVESET